jgi:hypothetical protein
MPATTTSPGRSQGPSGGRAGARGTGRKSPLRVVSELPPFRFDEQPGAAAGRAQIEAERAPELTAAQLRRLMISEFRDWLGARTSRDKRPFQADTISAYADAAIALDAWMGRDLMRLMGWEDRSMLDLYAKDMQVQRAIQAKRRRGDIYCRGPDGGNRRDPRSADRAWWRAARLPKS